VQQVQRKADHRDLEGEGSRGSDGEYLPSTRCEQRQPPFTNGRPADDDREYAFCDLTPIPITRHSAASIVSIPERPASCLNFVRPDQKQPDGNPAFTKTGEQSFDGGFDLIEMMQHRCMRPRWIAR
jgi:hypothetical protein